MFGLRWFESLFLPPNSPEHRREAKHKRVRERAMYIKPQPRREEPLELLPLQYTVVPELELPSLEEGRRARELSVDRHEEYKKRLEAYEFLFSPEWDKKYWQDRIKRTHEDIKPPWEDDDE